MSRRLPPQSSLENLKHEAKRWLKALRSNDAEARARLARALPDAPQIPTLRDVQLALARELGFPGWAVLKQQVAKSPPARSGLDRFERMAANLLEAYRTGTPEAMQRHWNDTWHRRGWDAMRRYVRLDLGKRPESTEGEGPATAAGWVDISLDDARLLIAREQGFETWQALEDHLASLPPGPRPIAAAPVMLFFPSPGDEHRDAERTRDWDAALEILRERRIPGLDARGQMTNEILERVSRLDNVTALRLGNSRALTDHGLQHLARMPQLRELDLGGCSITDDGILALRELPALENIGLSRTAISDAGAAHLANCEQLERVDLAMTATGDGAIRALAGKPKLRHLRSGNQVSDAGIPLLHQLPALRTWLGGEAKIALLSPDAEPNSLFLRGTFTDGGLARLAGLDGLFALNLADHKLDHSPAALSALVSLPHLGFLGVDATDEAMPHIATMPRLRFLMCQDTVAGDEGFVALSRSKSLEYIWGRRCHNLRGRGFAALADLPALRGLSVSCKNVGDDGLSALPSFASLRELMPMDVPDDGFRHVGRCQKLEWLTLMYCRETTDVATEHIAGLPGLTRYFVSYTRITDRTPEILARMPGLERIDLAGCPGVTNAGIAALAQAPRLRELHLSGMQNVTNEGVVGFPADIRVFHSV
ncbi:MAG: hypothetical protein HY700_22250 [Gemmatimonadetes bacterium]|nr:hypothetical protein [Gemmatimonadota bacterium]